MTKVPSYLTLRNDIYYFQTRIPHDYVHDGGGKYRLVRRSTRTGNRREALKIARTWWVELMSDKTNEEIEASAERHGELYHRGKELYRQHSQIDPQDTLVIDAFYGELSQFEQKALVYYGDHRAEQRAPTLPSAKTPVPQSNNLIASNQRLSDLLEQYMEAKINTSGLDNPHTIKKYYHHIGLMIEMVGDPLSQEFTVELLQTKYANRINKVPLNIAKNKAYFNGKEIKSIDEAIRIADKLNAKRISKSTVLDYVSRTRGFLSWCVGRGYVISNINVVLEDFKKVKKTEKIKVPSFTLEEQKALFESEEYMNGSLMKKPFRHWVPLISYLTGARLGEICQLHIEDIYRDEKNNVWVMDINDKGIKTVKTESSIRLVPIPIALERLGFITFFEQVKRRKEKQLFPDLKPESKNWGRAISRWFNEQYIIKCGIDKTDKKIRKSFHNLRHTMINTGKQQQHQDRSIIMELTGHKISDVHAEYEEAFIMKNKKRVINKIKYDIDINSIKKWPKR